MNDPLAYDPEDAYYGPLGEVATRHREQIQINLEAFYAMLLPAVGWLIGRRAVFIYQKDRHHPNLFTAVVGDSACGKGTTWNIIQDLLEQVEPDCPARLHRDVASAPGLIELVRDASTRIDGKRTIDDPGVPDKRCFVLFEEMENLFTSTGRTGSTLEKVWNMAWDGRTLENNAKDRKKATNPHVCCVAHITPESFQQAIKRASGGLGATNGFLNRWITIQARQERVLPRGGNLPDVADCADRIRQACAWLGTVNGGQPKRIDWHPDTHAEWDAFACAMHSDHPFLRGIRPIAARLKPMITRIAMLFALIDRQDQMTPEHLRAAKAFCLHCIDDSRGFFDRSKPSSAKPSFDDRLLTIAASGPCTLTDFHKSLGNKGYDTQELRESLARLVKGGEFLKEDSESDYGRTVPRWRLPDTLYQDPERTESECAAELVELDDEGQDLCDGCDESLREFVEVDGVRLAYGASAAFKCDTTAQALDGRRVKVREGQECYVAKLVVDATTAERDRAHARLGEHADHVCVIIGETPALAARPAVQVYSDDFLIA